MNPILNGGAASFQSVYQTTTIASAVDRGHLVGLMGQTPDGRVFYYTHNNGVATLSRGNLQVRATAVANHIGISNTVAAGSAPIGVTRVTSITIGATLMTADQYRGGYVVVTSGTAAGSIYKIRTHAAFASGASNVSFDIFDPIAVAWDATSEISFHKNTYDSCQASVTLAPAAGVPLVDIPVGSAGWLQTWGEVSIRQDGTPAINSRLIQSNAIAGAVEVGVETDVISAIGHNIETGVNTQFQPAMLTIRP